jgi:CelD/BcsL family acetyltransferase involved in cellulose biosynthesis
MNQALRVEVDRQLIVDADWDALAQSAIPASVFNTSGWLYAWAATKAVEPLLAVRVRCADRLVAAAAFEAGRDGIRFAGRGASDYADVMLAPELSDEAAIEALRQVLLAASEASPNAHHFDLRRMPPDSRAARLLEHTGFFVTFAPGVEAPWMCMSAAPEKLKKKSLVRHERGLAKRGTLECATWRRADDILPRLEAFFLLHVKRWRDTPSASLFLREDNRRFYELVTEHLGPRGVLRYTEIHLDAHLVAAHYGFSWLGRFTWYKPCFDPDLAKLSPGEVLIKRLIELAQTEQATCFDFTIGNEAFKHRLATEVPCVVNAHVTRSRLGAQIRKVRRGIRRVVDGRESGLVQG